MSNAVEVARDFRFLPGENETAASWRLYRTVHLAELEGSHGQEDLEYDWLPDWQNVTRSLGEYHNEEEGWGPLATAGAQHLIRRESDGLRVEVATPESYERVATTGCLRRPALELPMSGSWFWFKGSAVGGPRVARLYMGITSDKKIDTWCNIVQGLRRQGLPFDSKVLPGDARRPDNVVVYVEHSAVVEALRIVEGVVPTEYRLKISAGLACAVAQGISVGLPQDGEDEYDSLGLQRCRRISSAYFSALNVSSAIAARSYSAALDDLGELLENQSSSVSRLIGGTL